MSRRPVLAVIVDDEPTAREAVRTLLAEHREVKIVGEAGDCREAEEVIRSQRPDLLFLDIQMPGEDGFALLAALGQDVPNGIIFVTAHDEHAIRAFESHAFDYVLKPFGRQRFNAAVARALEHLDALDALGSQRSADSRRFRRLAIRNGAKLTLVDFESIDWLEADGDYVRVHVGKGTHLVTQRLHTLEQLLEPSGFVRIHRSLIVNTARVQQLHREADGSGTLLLHDGTRLRVARDRWAPLWSALGLAQE